MTKVLPKLHLGKTSWVVAVVAWHGGLQNLGEGVGHRLVVGEEGLRKKCRRTMVEEALLHRYGEARPPRNGKRSQVKEWKTATRPAASAKPGNCLLWNNEECHFSRSKVAAAWRNVITVVAAARLDQELVSQCSLVALRDTAKLLQSG